MVKAAEAFRTIGEVALDLDVPKHVLRFWEGKFPQIKPMKRGGGRRYYRPEDLELLRGIRHLLHAEGYTIKGVQKILREHGIDEVKAASRAALASEKAARATNAEKKRGRRAIQSNAHARTNASAAPARPSATVSSIDHAPPPEPIDIEAQKKLIASAIRELELVRAILKAPQGQPRAAERTTLAPQSAN